MPAFQPRLTGLLPALILALTCLACSPAFAKTVEQPRGILAVYNSKDGSTLDENLFANGLNMPANYLGLVHEWLDIAKQKLPDDATMSSYRAIVSVFRSDQIPQASKYLTWLLTQQKAGRKTLVFGFLGTSDEKGRSVNTKLVEAVFKGLGLKLEGQFAAEPYKYEYAKIDRAYMDYERKLPPFPPAYQKLKALDKSLHILASIRIKGDAKSESVVASVSKGGCFILNGYTYWEDPITYKKMWYVDPFLLLRNAIGLENWPVPTPATLNGKRVAISHIDGDGFGSITEIDPHKNCAELLYTEILKRYDFPVSVSIIEAEVSPKYSGNKNYEDIARKILALPNVEPATHTFTHPYAWSPENRKKATGPYGKEAFNPRGYSFNPRREIFGSAKYVTSLSPKNKPCRMLFWSGDCAPTEQQVAVSDRFGFLNINGGDTLWDGNNDSAFGVSSLYRKVGKHIQVYTGQANENILTNLWQGPFYGYRNIIITMRRTESPRRLMPIDIYYHFYNTEKEASIRALMEVYGWALKQDTTRMFTSRYIRMVLDFIKVSVNKTGEGQWNVANYGTCTALRFENLGKVPDLAKCKNVLGFRIKNNCIYVHLAEGKKQAFISMTKPFHKPQDAPYLESASGLVKSFTASKARVSLKYTGFSKGQVVIAGLEPGAQYAVINKGTTSHAHVNDKGMLNLNNVVTGTVEIIKL